MAGRSICGRICDSCTGLKLPKYVLRHLICASADDRHHWIWTIFSLLTSVECEYVEEWLAGSSSTGTRGSRNHLFPNGFLIILFQV